MKHLVAPAIAAILVAGCGGDPVKVNVRSDAYCSIYKPITWVPEDTPPTIDGIRRENAKHGRLCGRRS